MTVAFEIGPFSDTKEIWQKALDFLGVDNKAGNKTIKRLSPDHVQIIESDQLRILLVRLTACQEKLLLSSSHRTKRIRFGLKNETG